MAKQKRSAAKTSRKSAPILSSTNTKPQDNGVVEINIESFLTPVAIFVSALMISFSIIYSASIISGGNVLGANTANSNTGSSANTETPQAETGPVKATISIDDDAVLGDKKTAKVAIVEFSDYECPYCKRHFQQTYPQIKKDFIDTGKAILVFRDYPLDFHDPLASKQAMAAECVGELGGDGKYYEYHDLLFNTTTSNGSGMEISQLYTLASQVGVNSDKFKNCLDSEKYKEEVKKDAADRNAASFTFKGTPDFVVGVLDSKGNVDGISVPGAQPYSVFKAAIEEQLARVK